MKSSLLAIFILLALAAGLFAADSKKDDHRKSDHCYHLENVDIDIENGDIVITSRENKSTVIISRAYELLIDGKKIHTDKHQAALLEEYYWCFRDLIKAAKKMGYEGAEIGLRGAEIGLYALCGLAKAFLTDYEEEELEEDLEEATEQLEKNAEKLEKRAKKLERRAEELEELHCKLKEEIPALNRLDWF
ncbi:MAG: hypothetical protein Kow0042_17980 [Calditrichia bacterium]